MSDTNRELSDETVSVDIHHDRLCDRYEFLRKAGQPVTVGEFLRMEGIDPAAADSSLVRGLDALAVWYAPGNQPTVILPVDASPDPAGQLPEIRVGAVLIGRYELIEKIGEGGMGEVWRAQQTAPFRKLVAVKVIRWRAGQDARAILARFEAERQTLALMDHPNIARVRDAGTTDGGRPFFVMDLIKGVPITAFCDARRLSPKERLELFVPVCRAIQHAHQKGIIHRDIKPDNVLVALHDDRPVPVVIDFGIAKAFGQALTVESVSTGHWAIVGTPEYMSPEQATLNQLDIDTRSDVYSLGVLLYELLTGTTPVDRKSLGDAAMLEILRIVREVEAPRPSHRLSSSTMLADIATKRSVEPKRLGQQYRNELDWVLLKALEKDRCRRYESASDFAADIERHLNNELVEARPPTRGYRLRKFYHRHRSQVIAAGLVLFALVCGVIGTSVGLVEAEQARADEADRAGGERRAKEDARRAGEIAVRQRYDSDLRLIERYWADGRYDAARDLLARQVPERTGGIDLRGFEWHYWNRCAAFPQRSFNPLPADHAPSVLGAAVSGDGTRVAVVVGKEQVAPTTVGGVLRVYDRRTRAEVFARPVSGAAVLQGLALALSHDGTRLALADPAEPVDVWDLETRDRVCHLPKVSRPRKVEFSRDGRRLLVAGEPPPPPRSKFDPVLLPKSAPAAGLAFALHDARTGDVVARGPEKLALRTVALFPTGDRVAGLLAGSGGKGRVIVWDAATWKELAVAPLTSPPWTLAVSPDGKLVSVGCEYLGVVEADGGIVVLETTATVLTYDAASGAKVSTGRLTDGWHAHRALSFSPDSSRVLVSPTTGRPAVFDVRTGERVGGLAGREEAVATAAFAGDRGDVVAVHRGGTISTWELGRGAEYRLLHRNLTDFAALAVAVSGDGSRIACGAQDGTVRVFDPNTGQAVATIRTPDPSVRCVALSADGRRVFAGGGKHLTALDVATGKQLARWAVVEPGPKTNLPVNGFALDPTGRRVAAGWGGGLVKIWDAEAGTELAALDDADPGRGKTISALAYSPNGELLAVATPPAVVIWAVAAKRVIARVACPIPFGPSAVAFSPDGRRVACGGGDQTVRVADARTGTEVAVLRGHTQAVSSVAFLKDGTRIVSGAGGGDEANPADNSVRVWEIGSGHELLVLRGHSYWISQIAVAPDGRRIVSGGWDGKVCLWDAVPDPP